MYRSRKQDVGLRKDLHVHSSFLPKVPHLMQKGNICEKLMPILLTHRQENELYSKVQPYIKTDTKWIVSLNLSAKNLSLVSKTWYLLLKIRQKLFRRKKPGS